MDRSTPDAELLLASRREAARMRAAAAQLAPDGMVKMPRDQFARLAALIEALAARQGEDGPDCFHAAVDGIRWWVPLPEVERERAELSLLREELGRGSRTYRAAF